MKRTKSQDPNERVGIYDRIEAVPSQHRLIQYSEQYCERNVWNEFCTEQEYQQSDTPRFRKHVDRTGDNWCEHMNSQGRHPALATPEHAEKWCQSLLEDKSPRTAYDYWVRVRRFYDWLLWHTAHPHRYSPVMLAVIAGDASGEIWDVQTKKWDRARERYATEAEE